MFWEIIEKEDWIILFDQQNNVVLYFNNQTEVPYLINALLQITSSAYPDDEVFTINAKPCCDIFLTKENAKQLLDKLFPKYKNFCFDGLKQVQ